MTDNFMGYVWVFLLAVILTAILCFFLFSPKKNEPNGVLVVDPTETTPGDGVYLQIFEDPKTLKDGEVVRLKVVVVNITDKAE